MFKRITRTLASLLMTVCAADSMPIAGSELAVSPVPLAVPAEVSPGLLLVLPGVGNTRFHLDGFVKRAAQQLPGFEIVVRPWGVPFLTLHNLRAQQRNLRVASTIAAEITAWHRAHPAAPIYLVGYSGGGGMAALTVNALDEGVSVNRLVLVAPAISPNYPVDAALLPKVSEFIVNFASRRDLQVGWGTRRFGTIDRVASDSAGAVGFTANHERLLQWHWSPADSAVGHRGNHVAYLGRRWQQARLMPALHPGLAAEGVRRSWSLCCE